MLGPAYRWSTTQEGSRLDFHAGCVARVLAMPPDERGRAAVLTLEHFGRYFKARAASVAQGVRFVEAWIEAQDRRMLRPKRCPSAPVPQRNERTPAQVREWQRQQIEQSRRLWPTRRATPVVEDDFIALPIDVTIEEMVTALRATLRTRT